MDIGMFKTAIFVGRPDEELPLSGFSNVAKYFEKNPNKRLIVVARSAKSAEEIMLGVSALNIQECKFSILLWDDDTKLLDTLSKMLPELAFSKIFGMMWYECEEKHPTALKAGESVEECATCKSKKLTLIQKNEEEVKEFCAIFAQVVSLINFDTRSGATLHSIVDPTSNVLRNLPYAYKLPPGVKPPMDTSDILHSGKSKPAYLCAAGPSLEDAIPHLKRLQDTGIIMCVGRLYKHLRASGIRVDYTVSCEMFDWDSAIFDDVGDVGDTILLFPPVCAPATIQKWPGRRCCMWDMRTAELLLRQDYTLGVNSVAHHQLNYAAEILRCEPIILIGQDLAYTKPALNSHAGPQPEGWPAEVKEMDKGLQKELYVESTGLEPYYPECHMQYVVAGQAVPVGPVMVRSSYAYKDFTTLFSLLIHRHGVKVLNACPNGQKIKGAEYVNLATFDPAAYLLSLPQAPPATPVPAGA